MKKDSRKVMALMLLAAMTASMTAGCSGKSSETTSTTAATQATGTEAAGTEAAGTEAATESGLEGSLISAEPKEFTILITSTTCHSIATGRYGRRDRNVPTLV